MYLGAIKHFRKGHLIIYTYKASSYASHILAYAWDNNSNSGLLN